MFGPDTIYRIVAIDPGSDTLGVVVLDVDLAARTISIVHGCTIYAAKVINDAAPDAMFYGDRYARLSAQYTALLGIFRFYQPHAIVHESPFMRKFAEAYRALSECIQTAIRGSAFDYDPTIVIEYVDPPTAKISVGVDRRAIKNGSKDLVRNAIRSLGFPLGPGVNLEYWSEHTVDALAVGVWKAKLLLGMV